MKTNLNTPINYVQRNKDAEALLKSDATPAAVAARLIQITSISNPIKDAMGFEGQQRQIADLVRSSGVAEHRANAVLALSNSTMRASARISTEQREIFIASAANMPDAPPPAPSFEAARAFLGAFMPAGTVAGQKDTHNNWFMSQGPGAGSSFLELPSAEAVEARAKDLAKGGEVTDAHRIKAADVLAKEVALGSGAEKVAGRIFAMPYEQLEKVGGFALAKADSNNAESVEAASLGLLAHLSGKDLQIDPTLSSSEYKVALEQKLGDIDQLRSQLHSSEGRSWSELSSKEQKETTEYFKHFLGELALRRMGHRSYDQLSPDATAALSTTHDVYVHLRVPQGIFEGDWAQDQTKPFAQLTDKTKDADIPPFLFALNGMVAEAETSIRDATNRSAEIMSQASTTIPSQMR